MPYIPSAQEIKIEVCNLNAFCGKTQVLFDVSMDILCQQITAFIGPSGSGKSTLLRILNCTHNLVPGLCVTGNVLLDGEDLACLTPNGGQISQVRRRVGMLFQRPNPFLMSIFDNVAYGVRLQGIRQKQALQERVEWSLRKAALWQEVKDALQRHALLLSEGQQQLLCLARALAVAPEVLLLDEPCSSLDHATSQVIEDLIAELGRSMTIVLVTANPRQARRLAQMTGVLLAGQLIEYAPTHRLFTAAHDRRTTAFVADHL